MDEYSSQEKSGFIYQTAGCLNKVLQVVGLIMAIIGLVICFTGVGAIFGVPVITIGLFIGRMGLIMRRNPFGFLKGLFGLIAVAAAIVGIVYSIFEYPEYTKIGAVAAASLLIIGLIVRRIGFFSGRGFGGFLKGLLGVIVILGVTAGILHVAFNLNNTVIISNVEPTATDTADTYNSPKLDNIDIPSWAGYSGQKGWSIRYPVELDFDGAMKYGPEYQLYSYKGNSISFIEPFESSDLTYSDIESQYGEVYKDFSLKLSTLETTQGFSGRLLLASSDVKNILNYTLIDNGMIYQLYCSYDNEFKEKFEPILIRMVTTIELKRTGSSTK
ncbi:MAG: hypothetical protein BWY74_00659 [Firmicutes bacterium ADurb.Bin419]|nr:MAG: hypothetical protein BWY74_00659 [Firmicutes bacterium ADurb.Bin419]